jgi:hypothetical protein
MYKDVKLWFEDGIKTRATDDVWASEEQEREWQRDLITSIDNDNRMGIINRIMDCPICN